MLSLKTNLCNKHINYNKNYSYTGSLKNFSPLAFLPVSVLKIDLMNISCFGQALYSPCAVQDDIDFHLIIHEGTEQKNYKNFVMSFEQFNGQRFSEHPV